MNANPCRRYRKPINLLVCGLITPTERAELEAHLATCPRCRAYRFAQQRLGAGLHQLGERLPNIEPTAVMQARWAREIRDAAETKHRPRRQPVPRLQSWWRSLQVCQRAALGGLAAVWALILFFHLSVPEAVEPSRLTSPVSVREVIAFFTAQGYTEPRSILGIPHEQIR